MMYRCKIWTAPIAALVLMLGACSKSPEGDTLSDVGDAGGSRSSTSGDSGSGAFSSFESKISDADASDAMEPAPAPPAAPRASRTRESTSTETRETFIAGVVTTKTTRTTSERVALPMPSLPPVVERPYPQPPRTQQPVQSGLLTAGDYDDLLNPRAYASYASAVLQAAGRPLPFVDTRTRISVKVMGADNRPVPFAKVAVQRSGGPLVLTSSGDGTVSFYPTFDKISGRAKVTVSSASGNAQTFVDVGRGPQNVVVPLSGAASPVQALDIALVIDTTGSMGDEISYLQAELDAIVARIKRNSGNIDIRIGLIAYRDDGDEYVVKSFGMGSGNAARNALASLDAGGGGDTPEAMDKAMAAATQLPWRQNAVKTILLVADAPPHDEQVAATLAATQSLRTRGVQIVPIAASGVDDSAQYVMRTMSAMTQGRYIFLTDDSGVGNAHAEPQISCYLVTRLDGLVARVISGFVTGRRVEPRQDDVIREVGQYNRGRCSGEDGVRGQE